MSVRRGGLAVNADSCSPRNMAAGTPSCCYSTERYGT
jgi:hypothetical protein